MSQGVTKGILGFRYSVGRVRWFRGVYGENRGFQRGYRDKGKKKGRGVGMKVGSWEDFRYFVIGASIASGRVFWVGEEGSSNKHLNKNNTEIVSKLSRDGKVGRLIVKKVEQ